MFEVASSVAGLGLRNDFTCKPYVDYCLLECFRDSTSNHEDPFWLRIQTSQQGSRMEFPTCSRNLVLQILGETVNGNNACIQKPDSFMLQLVKQLYLVAHSCMKVRGPSLQYGSEVVVFRHLIQTAVKDLPVLPSTAISGQTCERSLTVSQTIDKSHEPSFIRRLCSERPLVGEIILASVNMRFRKQDDSDLLGLPESSVPFYRLDDFQRVRVFDENRTASVAFRDAHVRQLPKQGYF